MQTELKQRIRQALAGSNSKEPVDVSKLYLLGEFGAVQQALLAMYDAREVMCCLITRRTSETSVWWLAGNLDGFKDPFRVAQEKLKQKTAKAEAAPARCDRTVDMFQEAQ
jgi:hypothetical protein